MAAATLAERIAIDLRLLIPEARMVTLSRGPDPGTTEVTTRTAAASRMAAAAWEGRMGSAGAYDDADATVGNQTALSWATRYAKHLMAEQYQLEIDPGFDPDRTERRLMEELEMHRETAVYEASTPVVVDADGEVVE